MHWFRKDLRLHDNPSLCEALVNCRTFHAVYIIDPVSARAANVSANRWKFLLDCLTDLDKSLRDCGSRLHVIRGQPTYVLPKLFQEWNVSKLTFECETEPFGQRRDVAVAVLGEEFVEEAVETLVCRLMFPKHSSTLLYVFYFLNNATLPPPPL